MFVGHVGTNDWTSEIMIEQYSFATFVRGCENYVFIKHSIFP